MIKNFSPLFVELIKYNNRYKIMQLYIKKDY